jgi:DNA-binding response OmpR family regulator
MFIASHSDSFLLSSGERRPLVKRGAVTMSIDPVEIHWNAERVPLSPIEATLLGALIRRSRMRWDDVHVLLAEHGCSSDSRDVLIHRIRRKFESVGARDPIETLRGWGIRFRAEADAEGSTAFWIGVREGDPLPA